MKVCDAQVSLDGWRRFHAVEYDASAETPRLRVDRSKIISHGKLALGRMLLNLHMYWSSADVHACRSYYEDLSRVDGKYFPGVARDWPSA